MGCIDIRTGAVQCGAAMSISEQFPEDDLVRPKHVTVECDFNGTLK
jgi:hypothetical protein